MRCGGGDPTTVKFVDVGNPDYNVGFRKHAYDAVWVFDGWDVIRLRKIAKTQVTTIPFRAHLDCIPDWYTPVIVATEKTLQTINRYLISEKAYFEAADEAYAILAIQGPDAEKILSGLAGAALDPAPYSPKEVSIAGGPVRVARRSEAVTPGFHCWTVAAHAGALWKALRGAGAVAVGADVVGLPEDLDLRHASPPVHGDSDSFRGGKSSRCPLVESIT